MTEAERREHRHDLYNRKAHARRACRWNDGVRCWEATVSSCADCAWNPTVDRQRKSKLRHHGLVQQ